MGKSAIRLNRERWLAAKEAKKGTLVVEKVIEEVEKPKATPKVRKSLLKTLLKRDS